MPSDPDELLKLEDPVLETKVYSGNPAYKDPRYIHFKGKLEDFVKELKGYRDDEEAALGRIY